MNVYDFDKTIYEKDSTIDFYLYCMRHHPVIILCLPHQIISFLKYKMKMIHKTQFKSDFFCFMKKLDNPQEDIVRFWDLNQKKIKQWYIKQQKRDDVVISASPAFLLKVICDRLGIEFLIASEVDIHSGRFIGENCYGTEKVNRFKQVFKEESIHQFYTDSYSDLPLAQIAEEAFIVKKDRILCWKSKK